MFADRCVAETLERVRLSTPASVVLALRAHQLTDP